MLESKFVGFDGFLAPWFFAAPDQGSQNVTDPTDRDPDPMQWIKLYEMVKLENFKLS